MNGFQNPLLNPYGYMQQIQQMPQAQQQTCQVVKVNGENGARAFQMGANSSALLLDESGALIWLVTTDGAGYKTVNPYDISPHREAPPPEYGELESRIKKLEEMISNGNAGDFAANRKKQPNAPINKTDDWNGKRFQESAGYDQLSGEEQPGYAEGNGNHKRFRRGPDEGL